MKPLAIFDPHPRSMELLFSSDDLRRLKTMVRVSVWEGSRMPAEQLDRQLPQAAFFVGQSDMGQERLERAARLRAIINVEGNFQPNVAYETCFTRGIHVLGVGGAFGEAVAEMGLGMALCLARGIPEADRLFRQGKEIYGRASNQRSFLLAGSDVGFIGFGNLGRALLKLLAPFQCRVRVFDPWLPARWLAEFGLTAAPLSEVLSASQVVFVLAGATADNQAMLGKRELDLLRPGTALAVISRASLVDYDALTERLQRGDVQAAIDVFPREPFDKRHPLRRLPNVLLSAHRAGSVRSVYRQMGAMIVDDMQQILAGLPPVRLQRAERETVARMRSMPVK